MIFFSRFNTAQIKEFCFCFDNFIRCLWQHKKKIAKPLHSHTRSTENTLDVSLSFVAFYKYNEIISVSGLLYGCTSCKCTQCTHWMAHYASAMIHAKHWPHWQMHARSKENFAFITARSCWVRERERAFPHSTSVFIHIISAMFVLFKHAWKNSDAFFALFLSLSLIPSQVSLWNTMDKSDANSNNTHTPSRMKKKSPYFSLHKEDLLAAKRRDQSFGDFFSRAFTSFFFVFW